MRGLTPQNLLELCEWAEHEHPVIRALALLYAASPETSWEELVTMSIGKRDACLLELRETTFGKEMQGFVACQHCGEQLEFAVSTTDIRVSEETYPALTEYELEYQDRHFHFRLPDSSDQIAVIHHHDPAQASAELVLRCLLETSPESAWHKQEQLPNNLITAIAEQMSLCDPQAEILLNLQCPTCNQDSQSLFDISAFVWIEFVDLARQLMDQVHWLARGYGWHESDILKMTAWRRHYYQELLGL